MATKKTPQTQQKKKAAKATAKSKKASPDSPIATAETRRKRRTIRNTRLESNMTKQSSATDPFNMGNSASSAQVTVNFASEQGRRGAEVLGLGSGPIATSIVNMTVARRRSRHAALTNAYAKRAVDVLVSNVVGSGHKLMPMSGDEAFDREVLDLWEEWSHEVDVTGKMNFSSMEALAFRSMLEGGDCFVRMRTRRPSDNLPVPLQLQLYESEQVPVTKNENIGNSRILAGIQFGPLGNVEFYHMYRSHPGDFTLSKEAVPSLQTVAISPDAIVHLHDVRRPNEVRGLPVLSQSLIQLSELDRYMDAELVRKKAASLIGGFIRKPNDDVDSNPFVSVEGREDPENEDVHIEAMEPGTFPILPPGYDVSFSDPADVGGNFEVFMRQQLLMIAAAVNITYEQLTGDVSDVNDRTIRATMLEFKRMAENYQRHVLVHQFCRKIYNRWFDLAVLSGALTLPNGMPLRQAKKAKWAADPWEYLNPLQEVNVDIKKIRAGLKSRTECTREWGNDPVEVERQIIDERQREKDAGLIFDSNPEAVSLAGIAQNIDPTDNLMTEEEKIELLEEETEATSENNNEEENND